MLSLLINREYPSCLFFGTVTETAKKLLLEATRFSIGFSRLLVSRAISHLRGREKETGRRRRGGGKYRNRTLQKTRIRDSSGTSSSTEYAAALYYYCAPIIIFRHLISRPIPRFIITPFSVVACARYKGILSIREKRTEKACTKGEGRLAPLLARDNKPASTCCERKGKKKICMQKNDLKESRTLHLRR